MHEMNYLDKTNWTVSVISLQKDEIMFISGYQYIKKTSTQNSGLLLLTYTSLKTELLHSGPALISSLPTGGMEMLTDSARCIQNYAFLATFLSLNFALFVSGLFNHVGNGTEEVTERGGLCCLLK